MKWNMPLNFNEVDFSEQISRETIWKTLFVTQNKQYFDFELNTYNQITNARESNKKISCLWCRILLWIFIQMKCKTCTMFAFILFDVPAKQSRYLIAAKNGYVFSPFIASISLNNEFRIISLQQRIA